MNPLSEVNQKKIVLIYDALKKCCLVLDSAYIELEKDFQEASEGYPNEISEARVIRIYRNIFSIIDFGYRFILLINHFPGLNNKLPEMRKLNNEKKTLEEIRHYNQHMNNELNNESNLIYSPLGSVMWVKNNYQYLIQSISVVGDETISSIVYDREKNEFLHSMQFKINNYELKIDQLYDIIKNTFLWLSKLVTITPADVMSYSWGRKYILRLEFQYIQKLDTKLCIECSKPIDANAVTIMTGDKKGFYLCAECRKKYEGEE